MKVSVSVPRLPSSRLNPNRNQGRAWYAYAKAKAEDGELVAAAVKGQRLPKSLPWSSVEVRIHFVLPFKTKPRRRDWDNLIASCKGFMDGLVRAGVITDDGMEVIRGVSYSYENRKGKLSETRFEIEECE